MKQARALHPPRSVSRRRFLQRSLGVLTVPLAMSVSDCSGATEPEADVSPRLTARPGAPPKTPPVGFSALGSNQHGFLYVPRSYDPETPAPLLVILHGAGGTAERAWTTYADIADPRGVILVAPNARSHTWDMIHSAYGPDLAFLDQALHATFEHCNIDPARLALGGFSDGASYALSLGLSNGDLFSHLLAYSPGFFRTAGPIVGKPKVYVTHGTKDTILPVSLSRDVIVPTLRGAGYDVAYREFDGDHTVTYDIASATLDWLAGIDPETTGGR